MSRICVVGGGRAGLSAAAEAARNGTDVTVFEQEDRPALSRRSWPELIRDPAASRRSASDARGLSGVEVAYGTSVQSLGPGCRVSTSKGQASYDSIVVATGSRPVYRTFQGSNKPGVHILSSVPDYLDLAHRISSTERLIVYGTGLTAIRVASELAGAERRLPFISPGGASGSELNPRIAGAVRREAESKGISFHRADCIRALGADRIEALVADGRIFECEELAVVPAFVPNRPASSLLAGPGGRIRTTPRLEASQPGCYAAGGCAEAPSAANGLPVSLEDSAVASGRVAGANAAGRSIRFDGIGLFETSLFGLDFARTGLSLWEARRAGFDATESAASGERFVCSIVLEAESGRALGVQALGRDASRMALSMRSFASQPVSLHSFTYEELTDSTDILPLVRAAAQGLNWRVRRNGKGACLRPGRD